MSSTPLIMGKAQLEQLTKLREYAAANPVDMHAVLELMKTPEGKVAHKRQMTAQSIEIPVGFVVTLSIETGHPAGVCRHMSMSSPKRGRVPTQEAVQMVATALGFVGDIMQCQIWLEDLEGREKAVNVVQPVSVVA